MEKIRNVIEYPDPRLRQSCRDVTAADRAELRAFVDTMLDIMYTHEGVGLAAPQIGWNTRIVIVDPSNGENDLACRVMINPSLGLTSIEKETCLEGCLSLPDMIYNVSRPISAFARWEDVDGKKYETWLTGVEARIFLHELDHLSGTLISDIGTRATLKPCEDR